jgi:type II secretory pathway component PulM
MILRIILWSIILIFVVRFFIRVFYPILQVTKMANDRMQQMQKQMNDMQQKAETQAQQAKARPRVADNDYIDYEEIK